MSSNNSWTNNIEKRLLEWQLEFKIHSKGHGIMYDHLTSKCSRYQTLNLFIAAIGTIICTIGSIVEESQPYVIAGACISGATFFLSGWLKEKNLSYVANTHEDTAKGYQRVINTIDTQLSIPIDERTNGVKFLRSISDQRAELLTGSPVVPQNLWKQICKPQQIVKQTSIKVLNKMMSGQSPTNASDKDITIEIKPDMDHHNDHDHGRGHTDNSEPDHLTPKNIKGIASTLWEYQLGRFG